MSDSGSRYGASMKMEFRDNLVPDMQVYAHVIMFGLNAACQMAYGMPRSAIISAIRHLAGIAIPACADCGGRVLDASGRILDPHPFTHPGLAPENFAFIPGRRVAWSF